MNRLITSLGWLLALSLIVVPGWSQSTAALPVLTGLTVSVTTVDRGFYSSGVPPANEVLQMNFYLFVEDLRAQYDSIATVTVATPAGDTWTISKTKYFNLDKGYIGGTGSWNLTGAQGAGRTMIPTTYIATVTLSDGRSARGRFTIDPPSATPLPCHFLINAGFPGLVTPYHALVPGPARVGKIHRDSALGLEFTVPDPRITNGHLALFDAAGKLASVSPDFVDASGHPASWLNAGAGLFSDGRPNVVQIAFDQLKVRSAQPPVSLAVLTEIPAEPESNLARLSALYRQNSASYRIPAVGEDELTLANPNPQVQAARAPAPWIDSDEALRQWELRLEGVQGALGQHTFKELAPMAQTKLNRDLTAAALHSGWGVADRESLIQNLAWLRDTGHRKRFADEAALLAKYPGESDGALADTGKDEGLKAEDFRTVRAFEPVVGSRGLLAWDLCRMVYLARCGYLVGYLNEDEAWSWIRQAGDQLRDHYRSWRDLGEQYVVGRLYWGGEAQVDTMYLGGHGAVEQLLAPGGAWNLAPWAPPRAASADFEPAGIDPSQDPS
jgi:hypothetical protein